MFAIIPPLQTSGYLSDWTSDRPGRFFVTLGRGDERETVELGTTLDVVVLGLGAYFENDNPHEQAPKLKTQALLLVPSLIKDPKTRSLLSDWAGPVVRAFVPADWARNIEQDRTRRERVGHQELLFHEHQGVLAVQLKLVRSGKYTDWTVSPSELSEDELRKAQTFQLCNAAAIRGWVFQACQPHRGSGGEFGRRREGRDDSKNDSPKNNPKTNRQERRGGW